MDNKFVKKTESEDSVNNYSGFDAKKIVIDLDTDKVYLEVRKQFKNSNDEVITEKGYIRHELPEASFLYLLNATKQAKVMEYMEAKVNPVPQEEPEV